MYIYKMTEKLYRLFYENWECNSFKSYFMRLNCNNQLFICQKDKERQTEMHLSNIWISSVEALHLLYQVLLQTLFEL